MSETKRFDFSNKSDFEIEAHLRTLKPDSEPAIEALREQFRRKAIKENRDRKIQQAIKYMTLVILILTVLTFMWIVFSPQQ